MKFLSIPPITNHQPDSEKLVRFWTKYVDNKCLQFQKKYTSLDTSLTSINRRSQNDSTLYCIPITVLFGGVFSVIKLIRIIP